MSTASLSSLAPCDINGDSLAALKVRLGVQDPPPKAKVLTPSEYLTLAAKAAKAGRTNKDDALARLILKVWADVENDKVEDAERALPWV